MKYNGILLTGTSGSGKSSLARNLCTQDQRFLQVKAVTTRPPRPDDHPGAYENISEKDFDAIKNAGTFLIETKYREHRYGIRQVDLETVQEVGKVPVLILTPESAAGLVGISEQPGSPLPAQVPRFLSVFVDAPDEVLDVRLAQRASAYQRGLELEQRAKDRSNKERILYSIQNLNVDSSVELLVSLWDYSGNGGVLPDRQIRRMLNCGMLLERATTENVSGASYDLSLGDEYFYGGRIRQLTDNDPILLIEPYDYAIVTSDEISNLPRDVCARFDLSVGLFCQGIILSNGPQVDPGFRGRLFCLLFNTSSSPVLLKRGQHYATLEFHRLMEPTYIYRGKNQGQLEMIHYLPSNATRGAINELKKELEQVREESRKLQNMTWAILSLILAMIAIFVSFK